MEEGKTRLDRIEEALLDLAEQKKAAKVKGFKIPWSKRVNKKQAREGWVTIQRVKDNNRIVWDKQKIIDSTIIVDDTPRIVTPDEILYDHKGKPLIFLPNWRIKAWSPTADYTEAVEKGLTTQGYRLLFSRMKNEAIMLKKKMSGAMIIGGIVVLGVIGYLAFKGGLFK